MKSADYERENACGAKAPFTRARRMHQVRSTYGPNAPRATKTEGS